MTQDEIIEMAIQGHAGTRDAIRWAIKQALAAPVQEPVAWMHWLNGPCRVLIDKDEAMMELDRLNREYPADSHARKMRPLVFGDATPPAQRTWVGLTTEDMATCIDEPAWDLVLRKAEQILKEKNA